MDQSKQTETHKIFEKKKRFWKYQRHILEIPQSIEIDEQNAWVSDEMYFKNKVLNPVFPKLRFSSIKIVLHKKLKVFANLVGQTKDKHNYMYNV